MIRVGLTGGIASGKSTVADRLAEWGAVIIDADVLAREVVEPGTDGWRAVVELFGSEVVGSDGSLDRPALARRVFADEAARRGLEAIIHPRVRARANELEAAAPMDAVVVHVIPLLVETGQQHAFDLLVVVDVDTETQIARLARRNGFTRAEAERRIAAQASREQRVAAADVVLDNSRDAADLIAQVDALWQRLSAP